MEKLLERSSSFFFLSSSDRSVILVGPHLQNISAPEDRHNSAAPPELFSSIHLATNMTLLLELYLCNVQNSFGSVPGLKFRASLYGQFDVARMPLTGQTFTTMLARSALGDERRDELELLPRSI